jgi:hypothetical protein
MNAQHDQNLAPTISPDNFPGVRLWHLQSTRKARRLIAQLRDPALRRAFSDWLDANRINEENLEMLQQLARTEPAFAPLPV